MKKSITLHIKLYSNFPITFKKLNLYKTKQIFCKNYIVLYFLLKFFKKILIKNIINISIFAKKKKNNIITLLRAPFRHKLAKNQIGQTNNCLDVIIDFFSDNSSVYINSYLICNYLSKFVKFAYFFESNIIFQRSTKISLKTNILMKYE